MDVPSSSSPVLITGAAGFIGGEMARRFAEAGRSVATFDLPGRPVEHLAHPLIRHWEGDVTSRSDCERVLAEGRPCAIIHCAAAMGAATPREEFLRVNLGGSTTLAEAASRSGVRRFVLVSSVTVHGMPPGGEIDEESEIRSIGLPYADSKIATEAALRAMHERNEIALTILRPGDVYGPRSGEWVVKLVEMLRARKMILIGGGRGLVNVTYVDNFTDAVAACLGTERSVGKSYLITDGRPVTWKEYLADLGAVAGAPPPRLSIPAVAAWPLVGVMEAVFPLIGRRPPLGRLGLRLLTARTSYSIERARKELGWEPAVGYEEGMHRVGAWVHRQMPPAA